MAPKTPFMKALVGKQGNLPQHLKQAILDAPAKKTKKPSVEDDVVIDTKTKEVKRKRGGTNVVTTETSERGGKGLGTTMGDRKGVGRVQTKKYVKMKGTGRKGSKGSTISTKISGASGTRTLADGTKVVKEATVSTIKPRGVDTGKKKSKGKSPAKSYGKSPMKKTGTTQAMKNIRSKTTTSSGEKRMSNTPSKSRRKVYTKGSSSPSEVSYIKKEKSASAIKPRGAKKMGVKASASKSPAKMKGVKALKKKK